MADSPRSELIEERERFVFEMVFSDPVGDKVGFAQQAGSARYSTILCFVGIADVQGDAVAAVLRTHFQVTNKPVGCGVGLTAGAIA